ncbi:hypothetical protein [Streptomyces sp. VNUA24]|uniref:hypothetical protein n=1 Tax=Streptomyces sp. VNUA24 TaxID=3031131 RepID=UPI0023B815DF|nr:hypothetical protein [Streptomyces sp. VNUA24]WEH12306.1 hypothetical protein PYR72_00730 [Streptomyces sp. VNUA24]
MTPVTRHHAVEILLTRPLSPGELKRARRAVPLAANADRTRLMAVQDARSPSRALHRLRRRLDSRLPIDVLSTHYPDCKGQVQLNIAFSRSDDAAIRKAAACRGQRPGEFLSRRVTAALAEQEQQRLRAQQAQAETTPAPQISLRCNALSATRRQRLDQLMELLATCTHREDRLGAHVATTGP